MLAVLRLATVTTDPVHAPPRRQPRAVCNVIKTLLLPQKPSRADPSGSGLAEVIAMYRGGQRRQLWLGLDSMEWLISFAADEINLQGVIAPYFEEAPADRTPTCPQIPGLWKSYTGKLNRICFQFLEGPPAVLNRTRYMSLGSITEPIYKAYKHQVSTCCDDFEAATKLMKRHLAEKFVLMWAQSMLDGHEETFVKNHNLPFWKMEHPSDTAIADGDPACISADGDPQVTADDAQDIDEGDATPNCGDAGDSTDTDDELSDPE